MPLRAGAGPVNPDDCHILPRVTGGPNLPHPRGSGDPLDGHTHTLAYNHNTYMLKYIRACLSTHACTHMHAMMAHMHTRTCCVHAHEHACTCAYTHPS